MQRYFAKQENNKIILNDGDIHHILHVMRMKENDEIEVVIDSHLYDVIIVKTNPLELKINYEIPNDSEINQDVTLFYVLAKGEKNDLVTQKATELGVKRIVLLTSERCIIKWEDKETNKKIGRLNKIAKEASEQSHRLMIPEILGVYQLNDIPTELLAETNLFAYEKEAGNTTTMYEALNSSKGSVSVLVGPEGGFSEKEAEFVIKKYHFVPVSLGKRILRSETAAIYALSVISYTLEK